MKIKVVASVIYPVQIDHEIEVEDPKDMCEVQEKILDMAAHIMQTSSIEGIIEGTIGVIQV